jgi:vancomycin resistance protein YoaR
VGLITLISLAGVVLALLAAWAIDNAVSSGDVARNVTLAGRPVGGMPPLDLDATVDQLAAESDLRPVVIETPGGTLETTAATVGLRLDQTATADAVLAVRDRPHPLARPFVWLGSLFTTHEVTPSYVVDPQATEAALADLAAANLTPATEPGFELVDGVVQATAGADGTGLDQASLDAQLLAAVARPTGEGPLPPVTVQLGVAPLPPATTDAEAAELADEANALTQAPLTLEVGGTSATVEPAALRSWLRAVPGPDGGPAQLSTDLEAVQATLTETVGQVGTPAVQLSWNVSGDGTVSYTPGTPGTTCCAPDSAQRIVDALTAGQSSVALAMAERPPEHDAAWAESMGITQQVASFTTNHACCEARVENIQRMADMVRGVVIAPGETFSLNGHIGPRTTAKGYKPAGVIYNGEFTEDVGGGVSQFTTTMFNAAFFAGLEIPEYMAHTIYISRYPYGREATLSYPNPDLKITNETPHGILVWPSYTGTSITVTLYSTPTVTAEQTGQSEAPSGACTRVTTQRTRTWLADGRQEVDEFYARYQPAEGVLC